MKIPKLPHLNFRLRIIGVIFFILIVIYFLLSFFLNQPQIFKNKNQKFISCLIAILDDDKRKTNDNDILSLNIVFYFPKLHYFYIYQVGSDVYLKNNEDTNPKDSFVPLFKKSTTRSPRAILKSYEKYSQQKIDYHLILKKNKLLDIMQLFGGCLFFNLYSTNMNFGEVILDKRNYDYFMEGISDEYHYRDTKLNIWINQISDFLKKNTKINYNDDILNEVYKQFHHTSLKKNDFSMLVKYLSKNLEKHYVNVFNMSIERREYEGRVIKIVADPVSEIKKINTKIGSTLNQESLNLLKIPTIEIKNATSIKRLATKTAGVLRRKYFNVIEYGNNKFQLENSVILKNLGTPSQEKFIIKATKINTKYYMYDYKSSSDFSLYLGDDYYGAKYLKQQNKKSK